MSGSTDPILVVEADDETRLRYDEVLRDSGFDVRSVGAYSAAAQLLDEFVPRLVVASFELPTRDECIALCVRLKADPRTRAVPIILASAIIDEADLLRATHISALALAVAHDDGMKLASAVKGVLAVRPSAA